MGRTTRRCPVGHFHLMGSLVVHCDSLEDVLRQSIRCYDLFSDDLSFDLNLDGEEAELSLSHRHPELDPDDFLIEWLLMTWHRLVGWLAELNAFVLDAPEGLFIWTADDNSVSTQVRRLLERSQETRLPNMDWIAATLNMTAYTLSRKLKSEGNAYQNIKDNLRRDQAVTMLTRQNLSVADIASQLGFTEAGAFSRAFKHWTGVSPLAYRHQDSRHQDSRQQDQAPDRT